jgi:hypothetical protein
LRVPIQTVFHHTTFAPIITTISSIDTIISGSCTSLYTKTEVLSPLQPEQWANLARCFAGAGSAFSADTWRKEYKSRTLKPGQYFPALPRDVSARMTRKSREKKNSVTQDPTLQTNVLYCVVWNTFFPIKRDTWLSSINTNRYRILACKITENNKQNLTAVLRTHKQSLKLYRCAQRQACSAYCSRALARCAGGWRFPAVCIGPNGLGGCALHSGMVEVCGHDRYIAVRYRCVVRSGTRSFLNL